jgi:hypothetical protein
MALICSCCKQQELKIININFKVGEELCNASALQCVNCTHIQEIINIVSETIPIKGSDVRDTSGMRDLIDKTKGAKKETPHLQPIDQTTLQALKKQNINVSYDSDGNPLITALNPEKPVLQKYVPNDQKALPIEPNPGNPTNL